VGDTKPRRGTRCNRGATGLGVSETAEAIARRSYGKLVALLAARTRDLARAEDALSEAFAAALAEWPVNGVPRSPEAWLLTVARRKLIDAARRAHTSEEGAMTVALVTDELFSPDDEGCIPDERLRLMFTCAHPAIDPLVRAPLMLQVVLGFDAATIASAFLVPPSTMSQRLVRAKTRIRNSGIPFRIPERDELRERLGDVLAAIYAIYTQGWADASGTLERSRGLTEEAVWLGALVKSLLPGEPEPLGLLSLMLHTEARRRARRGAEGEFIPLDRQDPTLWDEALITEAEGLLWEGSRMEHVGRFQLEAAVQSVHAARRLTGTTDWVAIVKLYDGLLALTDSVVVAINRAVAIGFSDSAAVGLRALDALSDDARLAQYQPYWAAKAALLERNGNLREAAEAYTRAIGLETDPALRRFLQHQLAAMNAASASSSKT
jgi:RNA polymerase sigma-70 factor (ECF subfamily)